MHSDQDYIKIRKDFLIALSIVFIVTIAALVYGNMQSRSVNDDVEVPYACTPSYVYLNGHDDCYEIGETEFLDKLSYINPV